MRSNRWKPRGTRHGWGRAGAWLALVVAPAVLAACGGSEPQTQSLSVASQAPAASPTGPTASEEASPTDTTPAQAPTDTPTSSPTRSRPVTTAPRTTSRAPGTGRATVTRTVPGKASTTAPAAGATAAAAAAKVLTSARTAMGTATSAHFTGTVVSGGTSYGIDLTVGTDAEGVMRYPGGTIAVRRVGTNLYLQPDDAFFTAHKHPELAAAYQGLWMPIDPADPAYATIMPLTRLATWTKLLGSAPAARTGAGTAVDGVPTVAVSGGTGAKANTLLVPASGPALPVLTQSADRVDQVRAQDWNKTVAPVATPTGTKDEPDDALVDVPSFAEETAEAFGALWH